MFEFESLAEHLICLLISKYNKLIQCITISTIIIQLITIQKSTLHYSHCRTLRSLCSLASPLFKLDWHHALFVTSYTDRRICSNILESSLSITEALRTYENKKPQATTRTFVLLPIPHATVSPRQNTTFLGAPMIWAHFLGFTGADLYQRRKWRQEISFPYRYSYRSNIFANITFQLTSVCCCLQPVGAIQRSSQDRSSWFRLFSC